MNSGPIGNEVVVMALFCVLAIFLFPSMQGPYSAVNGPVTALQAVRVAARVRATIRQAASRALIGGMAAPLIVLSWMPLPEIDLRPRILPELDSVLRC